MKVSSLVFSNGHNCYIYMHTKSYTYVYINTHMYIYIHTYTHIYIYTYTYIHTHIYIYIYTYFFIHTYVRTYIHTHTYIYIHDMYWNPLGTVQAIVDMKAHLEAETVYYGRPGHRPLTIACSEGRLDAADGADGRRPWGRGNLASL